MKSLMNISTGSISILLPVYFYYPVLISYRFLYEATGSQIMHAAINHLPPILPQIPDKIRLLPLQLTLV